MSSPRLGVLISTHLYAQGLLPELQRSHFAVERHCLAAGQLHDAIESGDVDIALVSTGPRGLDHATLVTLAKRRLPLVVLDSQPHHQRWASFEGIVLRSDASPETVLRGLDAAMRGEQFREPVDRTTDVTSASESMLADQADQLVEVRSGDGSVGRVFAVVGGHGAPGRSTVALNLAVLLGRVASTVLVDVDLGAPILSARLGANTNKNLVTVAHMAPTTSIEWTLALSRDLQPIRAGDCPHGLFLAGLPKTETKIEGAFLVALLDALRARFDYVVCDTGVQWLDGDRAGRVPAQHADQVLLVATPDAGGIRRAHQTLDRLRTFVGPVTLGAVINQHRAHKDYERGELEYALAEQLSAVLPFDPNACWRAIEDQRPVVFDLRSTLGRSLLQFAERLHGGQLELPRPAVAPRRLPWWAALRRWPTRRSAAGSTPARTQVAARHQRANGRRELFEPTDIPAQGAKA